MSSADFGGNGNPVTPNKNLASACGLYCGSCGIYLATQERDTEKLLQYAIVLNQHFNETLCDGFRSDRKSAHCSKTCPFIKCTLSKGIEFCIDCNAFPCKELTESQSALIHRVEILESQIRLKEIGLEKWLSEMHERYSCPQCNTINNAYQIFCRKCKHTPSCRFVRLHQDLIEKHMSKE